MDSLSADDTVILVDETKQVEIRPITDVGVLREVENLQQRIWGMTDREVVPTHQLLAIASAGGVMLGAFTPAGELIGFCYGFAGQREGRSLLYSHMAGVVEGYRGQEVGFRLKAAQREAALARGLDWMVWTFDPLQIANASFNLRRLGARAGRYYVNYYGEMADDLNRGVESDRLEVDWRLRDARVARLMTDHDPEQEAAPDAPVVLGVAGDPPRPQEPRLDLDAPELLLAGPANFTDLRRQDLSLARRWRAVSRAAFQTYFRRGYTAVDFARTPEAGYYVLRRVHAH